MYFPSNFSVCGAGLVRNSVDELFAEGTCNVLEFVFKQNQSEKIIFNTVYQYMTDS